jgi:YceG-like family
MSDDPDWVDPFVADEEAAERERRRAEREAKRRQRRQGLGEKVGDAGAATNAPPASPPSAQPVPAAPPPPAAAPPGQPTLPQPVAPAPPHEETGEVPPLPPALGPRRPPGGGGPPSRSLLIRRVIGGLIFLAVAGLLVFGVTKVINRINRPDPPPVKTKPLKVEKVVIPEGYDRHQIAAIAKKDGLKGDYEQASKSFKGFKPAKYGADNPPNLDGFLFPATYDVPKNGTVKDLISRQLDQGFVPNIKGVDMSYAKSKNLTVYDVLKIASMIEREVSIPKERPLVAEVIYNRLKQGIPLGIDATIRYEDQNYDEQLLQSRLDQDTPYNTRLNTGLPPTPIGNPGLASIEAAANPAKGNLLYFVVKPGTCGETTFTASEAEFAQAQAAYQQALAEQGGAPTQC